MSGGIERTILYFLDLYSDTVNGLIDCLTRIKKHHQLETF